MRRPTGEYGGGGRICRTDLFAGKKEKGEERRQNLQRMDEQVHCPLSYRRGTDGKRDEHPGRTYRLSSFGCEAESAL